MAIMSSSRRPDCATPWSRAVPVSWPFPTSSSWRPRSDPHSEEALDAHLERAAARVLLVVASHREGGPRLLEVSAARPHDAAHLFGDFRPRSEQLLERGTVEAVALDVALGDHGRAAGLAGEQRHLAEDLAGVDSADDSRRAARRLE